jgi:hypothetical protein
MSEQDYDLHHDSVEEPPKETSERPVEWWIAGGLLFVAAVAAAYLMFGKRPATAPAVTTASTPAAAAKEPARPLGGEGDAIAIPPLGESDAVVRTLVRALSNHPVVAAWLATNGLIRSFTVAVSNISEGSSPAKQLNALRPGGTFPIVETNGALYLDPRGYARYEKLAAAAESIDAAGAAKLYATLKPRIEDAAGELGLPPGQFDEVLEQSIVLLLRTPVPDRPPQVRPNREGIGYAFADPSLEGLSPAQKTLIRMGTQNARIIKAKLREIALALGVAPAHLPAV